MDTLFGSWYYWVVSQQWEVSDAKAGKNWGRNYCKYLVVDSHFLKSQLGQVRLLSKATHGRAYWICLLKFCLFFFFKCKPPFWTRFELRRRGSSKYQKWNNAKENAKERGICRIIRCTKLQWLKRLPLSGPRDAILLFGELKANSRRFRRAFLKEKQRNGK